CLRSPPHFGARTAAWLSAAAYAGNLNLIYLQTTAMTECLYLALFIWAVVYFSEFVQEQSWDKSRPDAASSSLMKCGLCLAAACLTRYDGWFLAAAVCVAALAVVLKSKANNQTMRRGFAKLVLLAGGAPVR